MSGKLGNVFRKAGGRGTGGGRRFSSFCEEWLAIQRSRVRESTFVKYETVLKLHVLPALGDLFPAEMSTQVVEAFKTEMFAKGLCGQTVKNILTELRSVLKYAALQYPGVFPPIEVVCPREAKKEARVLSAGELRDFTAFLQAETEPCKFGILLALMTGLRIGEICALKWENISLAEGTLKVCATMQRLRDVEHTGKSRTKIFISSPKSSSSARLIPLPKNMTALCRRNAPAVQDAYVLTGNSSYMEPRTLQRRLAKYAGECGLAGVHFHTLRHTFATRCMELGFEIKSLSEILGHASTTTTLDRYVHSSLELKRANMDRLNALGALNTSGTASTPKTLSAFGAYPASKKTQIG